MNTKIYILGEGKMAEVKTVRLNEEEYEKLIEARNQLLHKGIDGLPPKFREVIKKEVQEEMGRFTLGLIVGIGAMALVEELLR